MEENYVLLQYEIDLEAGSKVRRLHTTLFHDTDDVCLYLNEELRKKAVVSGEGWSLGTTSLEYREALIETLLASDVELEAVADAVPEGCLGGAVIALRDNELGRAVHADFYVIYELKEFR